MENLQCSCWFHLQAICRDARSYNPKVYFDVFAENVNTEIKNNLINEDNDSIDNRTHFMEQAFNKPYTSSERKCISTKEIEQTIKSPTTKNSNV